MLTDKNHHWKFFEFKVVIANLQIYKFTNLQIYKSTNLQIHVQTRRTMILIIFNEDSSWDASPLVVQRPSLIDEPKLNKS